MSWNSSEIPLMLVLFAENVGVEHDLHSNSVFRQDADSKAIESAGQYLCRVQKCYSSYIEGKGAV